MPFQCDLIHAATVIGFNMTLYDVSEDEGRVVVYIVVRNGVLHKQVNVNIFTADDSALSELKLWL